MDQDKNVTSHELLVIVDMFDCLDGQRQLELLGIIIEKLENGEIELNGKQIIPEEIGIDDAPACCSIIEVMTKVGGRKLAVQQIQGIIG